MSEQSLAGKVAVITGAGRGFGRLFADVLGEKGARMAILDMDPEAAKGTVAELEQKGVEAFPVGCDVSNEDDVDSAIASVVGEFGGVDVLINNAGKHLMKYKQPFSVLPRDEVRALFEVNVIGVVNCSVACKESMKERGGGSIVNIASIAGHTCTTPYGVSKLAVRGLTRAFANEFAADNIRVNAISPGLMATESAMDDLPQEMIDDFVNNKQLIPRLGQPEELVGTLLYLCTDASAFVTGETLIVSGGFPIGI